MSEMMSNIKCETQTFPTILHQSLKSHTVEEKHNYLMTSYCYAKQHQAWLKEKVLHAGGAYFKRKTRERLQQCGSGFVTKDRMFDKPQ